MKFLTNSAIQSLNSGEIRVEDEGTNKESLLGNGIPPQLVASHLIEESNGEMSE